MIVQNTSLRNISSYEITDDYQNFSFQAQIVADHQRKIRDIFLGFPGSVHDSRVFRASPLSRNLQEKCGNYYLLGDSGYPCLPNLLVPFKDRGNLTRRQRNYNSKLSRNRYIIEHTFGILKQKFRQLYHVKLRKIPDICHLIRACCVLYNLSRADNFPDNIHEENGNNLQIPEQVEDEVEEREDRNGLEMRNHVMNLLHF